MKFTSQINNVAAYKWGLNLQEAVLFDWLSVLPTWAEKYQDNENLFFASRNEACRELPLLTTKPDTIYRYYKSLDHKGIIKYQKIGGRDYIEFTEKTKDWFKLGEISEQTRKKIRTNSEKFPTNKNTINNNTKDKERESLFLKFWDMYDKKVDTAKVKKKFMRLDNPTIENIFEKLPRYIESKPDKAFRKNPLTWLNGECWNDEIIEAVRDVEMDSKYKPKRFF